MIGGVEVVEGLILISLPKEYIKGIREHDKTLKKDKLEILLNYENSGGSKDVQTPIH